MQTSDDGPWKVGHHDVHSPLDRLTASSYNNKYVIAEINNVSISSHSVIQWVRRRRYDFSFFIVGRSFESIFDSFVTFLPISR
jgi:hypothetical protein